MNQNAIASPGTKGTRQRAGAACEECRKRKLRCDGQQPQCRVCRESGAECEFNMQRGLRGPKKGYLRELKDRVETLEKQLVNAKQQQQQPVISFDQHSLALSPALDTSIIEPPGPEPFPSQTNTIVDFALEADSPFLNSLTETSINMLSGISMADNISDVMRSELDQLYFDRMHPSMPILHQSHYLSWSNQPDKKPSRRCLQSAMWTLASLVSLQLQHFQKTFYQETKQYLDMLTSSSDPHGFTADTERLQAIVLTAIYEIMKAYHQQAWMSAGQAFRLAQLMRFHEIDHHEKTSSLAERNPTEIEEQRRAFWMAFVLENILSIRNGLPVSLNAHLASTRLPVSDTAFQSGQSTVGDFISEATFHTRSISAFCECIIFTSILSRSLSFGRKKTGTPESRRNSPPPCEWLDEMLTSRLRVMSEFYPSPTELFDPMLLVSKMMAQTCVIKLCQALETVPISGGSDSSITLRQRAKNAAERIVELTKVLTNSHSSKIHALIPIPLTACTEFLYENRMIDESCNIVLQDLLGNARQLRNISNPNQSYLDILDLSFMQGA